MPIIRYTMFFEGPGRGWTESYYLDSANSDLRAVLATLNDVIDARTSLMSAPCILKAHRVSNVDKNPDSLLVFLNRKGVINMPSASLNIALLLRCRTNDFVHSKAIYVRGFPDEVEIDGGQFIGDNAAFFNLSIQRFKTVIDGHDFGWLGSAFPKQTIVTGYVSKPSGSVEFSFGDAFMNGVPPNTPTRIRISGYPVRFGLNGQHIVIKTGENKAETLKPLAVVQTLFQGKGFRSDKVLRKIDHVDAVRVVPRKAGAPLLVTRGRQRAL